MSWFDLIFIQPIFNLLALIYNFIGDFGVAIIILTIIVRFALYPLVKKQMHQTKLMRKIQPELKKIKQKANGNRMLESQMMMELYREKGVKMSGQFLPLLIQLPIMIAIFSMIQLFNMNLPDLPAALKNNADCAQTLPKNAGTPEKNYCAAVQIRDGREEKLRNLAYPGVKDLSRVKNLTENVETFKPKLFGIVDLTANGNETLAAFILVLLVAGLQFIQSKQTMPQTKEKKKLREMFADAKNGKQVDQADMMAATTGKMIYFMPIMFIFIGLILPAAVLLYYATNAGIAILQQHYLLNKSEDEMEKLANAKPKKPSRFAEMMKNAQEFSAQNSARNNSVKSSSAKNSREKNAVEAEIVSAKEFKKSREKSSEKSAKNSGGQTVVRRIKAK